MEDCLIENPLEFLEEKRKKGCLFLLEKYLDKLPHDWFDCISFIFSNGIDQRNDTHLIILDEKESEKLFKVMSFEQVPVYIFSEKIRNGKKVIWNLLLTKEYLENDPDPKALFVGGENIREYCDEKNIFYKSALTKDNKLLSGTNMKWQKNEREDCRKPIEMNKEQRA